MNPKTVFDKLLHEYGAQGWWPVSDILNGVATYKKRKRLTKSQQFEVCVGAILTQNTAWKNAERAINNLKSTKLFSLEKMASARPSTIANHIRPSGYFNQKTKKLQIFCKFVLKKHGSIKKMLNQEQTKLRSELISLHGIGPETADSIILYAGQQPVFVVDAYTRRFVVRYFGKEMNYEKTQAFFEEHLPKNSELFNEYHALLVEHAKRYCKTKPDCVNCFLKSACVFGKKKLEKERPTNFSFF